MPDTVDLCFPLALPWGKCHHYMVHTGHVALHCFHTPSCVPIMVTGEHHSVVLADMVVQRTVVCRPKFTEGTESCCYHGNSIHTCLVTSHQRLLSMQAPQAHQACATKVVGIIVGDILATGTSYDHHDIFNGYGCFGNHLEPGTGCKGVSKP